MQNLIINLQKENIPECQHVSQTRTALIPLTFQLFQTFRATFNTAESTFVVPILILHPEVQHKAT